MSQFAFLNLDAHWSRVALLMLLAWAVVVLVALALSRLRRNSTSAMLRLDWYLPTLRKRRVGSAEPSGAVSRLLRSLLPTALLSNRDTKRRGWIRRSLRSLGLSWLASPVRRLSQAVCLLIFFGLFLVTCWPYSAKPASDRIVLAEMQFVDIDHDTGDLNFSGAATALAGLAATPTDLDFFLVADSPDEFAAQPKASVANVQVASISTSRIALRPSSELSNQLLDALLSPTSNQWSLHESDPQAWPAHYTEHLLAKEILPAEFFLAIDPLVSLSTAIASRSWVWSLSCGALILLICIVIPRGFCGYLCPLGTTIDLFDWAIGRRVTRLRVSRDGWWVHIKYYLLAGTLICAVCGVLVSGFVSAIPVITRAALLLVDPLQNGMSRGWHLVPGMNFGHLVSIALFLTVLGLGFFQPRFWCKYVCPSGAVFSVGNLFRATERKVESSCIHCNKCVEICPFDAIKPDFTTRETDCTLCQSCAGVCPTHAIKFVERGNRVELKVLNDPPTGETTLGRRGFLSMASGSAAAVVGGMAMATTTKLVGAGLGTGREVLPVRPPGSVPEDKFLQMCIRCGECFKVCPNNVLQLQGFEQGLEGLWTPVVKADWAGCESSCNACGQVCPTGAIRALPLEEKRHARMGLAAVNEQSCLPFAGVEDCDLCVQECNAAGYQAIEYLQVGTQTDEAGLPIEGSGFLAPVVIGERCVGCGLCQTRCHAINVKENHLLSRSAIIVEAGAGKEDRLLTGSYKPSSTMEQPLPWGQPPESATPAATGKPPAPPVGNKDFGENPFGLP